MATRRVGLPISGWNSGVPWVPSLRISNIGYIGIYDSHFRIPIMGWMKVIVAHFEWDVFNVERSTRIAPNHIHYTRKWWVNIMMFTLKTTETTNLCPREPGCGFFWGNPRGAAKQRWNPRGVHQRINSWTMCLKNMCQKNRRLCVIIWLISLTHIFLYLHIHKPTFLWPNLVCHIWQTMYLSYMTKHEYVIWTMMWYIYNIIYIIYIEYIYNIYIYRRLCVFAGTTGNQLSICRDRRSVTGPVWPGIRGFECRFCPVSGHKMWQVLCNEMMVLRYAKII